MPFILTHKNTIPGSKRFGQQPLESNRLSSSLHILATVLSSPTKSAWLLLVVIMSHSVLAPRMAVSDEQSQLDVALKLATLLRAARTVIATNQTLINDETKDDKGLTGDVVVQAILDSIKEKELIDVKLIEGETQAGRLMRIQLGAFKEIIDENQALINQKDTGFKGFVPAVFAQLSNERFGEIAGNEASIKVTAPKHLVRNRKARPDKWEDNVIAEKFSSPEWPKGELYAESISQGGQSTFRVIVPEYYGQACLACHGAPTSDVDVTGYPKEGGSLGDLGGAISITLKK